MKILLIRHGKTPGNQKKQYIGSTDESLSERGRLELKLLTSQGIYPSVEEVYSSPLRRCLESVELVYPGLPYHTVTEISECDFGEFEKKTYQELKDRKDYTDWIGGKESPPGGEGILEFKQRVIRGFEEILEMAFMRKQENIAVFLHGGSIMAILEKCTKKQDSFYEYQVENGRGFQLFINEIPWKNIESVEKVMKF